MRPRFALSFFFITIVLTALAFGGCGESTSRESFVQDAGPAPTKEKDADANPKIDEKDKPKNPDEAAAPEVDAISPDSATVGAVGPSIIVSGNNFVPRSIVQLDGAPLATSFVSGTELRATIPSGKLTTVGTLRISVGTAPPGGGASKEVAFNVVNPMPQVTALSPLSVVAGAGTTQLEVTGDSFVDGAKIVFGTTDLATTFTSSTSLKGTISSGSLGTSSTIPVTVVNPTPGGGTSTSIAFTISNPSASINPTNGINPSAAFVGSAALTMTVNGTGFVSSSAVLFNGTALATTYVSSIKLTAQVPANKMTAAGDFPIAVQNQPPGGGVSAPVVFKVQYPTPSVTTVSPSTIAAGSSPTEIQVTGVGFFLTSQITFDGAPCSTVFVDGTHVKTTLSAMQLANAQAHSIRVVNPTPGGGTSSALALTVANGVPQITGLNPSSVFLGSAATSVTVYGSGFVAGSTVNSNGQSLNTIYVSGGQINATVPANYLLNPGSVAITVTNPTPGGGTSTVYNLVVGCDPSGVSVSLATIGAVTNINPNFSGTGLQSRWDSPPGTCLTSTLNSAAQQPGRYLVVQNNTGQPVVLSAWADCTGLTNGDAFMTFYRRPTIPANDTERLGCANVVSEGSNAGYGSPEANGSIYCPGLTKANGGGITLAVCEKAVVHFQPYDYQSAAYPPPPRFRMKAESP